MEDVEAVPRPPTPVEFEPLEAPNDGVPNPPMFAEVIDVAVLEPFAELLLLVWLGRPS